MKNKVVLLISVITITLNFISDSFAGCEGCEGDCVYKGWGYACSACKSGYELISAYNYHTCTKICSEDEFRYSMYECAKIPACIGGSACKDLSGNYSKNCCYKTEGDITTMYPDNKGQEYIAGADIPENKVLVLENGASAIGSELINNFETVYINENSSLSYSSGGWCLNEMPKLKHLMLPDSGVQNMMTYCGSFTGEIVCLGDIEKCKSKYITGISQRVVSPTESQCNGSGTYYYTGSECAKRPAAGTDITCDYEVKGYAKVGNYCASPENSYAKKRYTPAEAAQWLKEDDNTVILTFKK